MGLSNTRPSTGIFLGNVFWNSVAIFEWKSISSLNALFICVYQSKLSAKLSYECNKYSQRVQEVLYCSRTFNLTRARHQVCSRFSNWESVDLDRRSGESIYQFVCFLLCLLFCFRAIKKSIHLPSSWSNRKIIPNCLFDWGVQLLLWMKQIIQHQNFQFHFVCLFCVIF